MTRELLSAQEIADAMTAELQTHEECEDARMLVVVPFKEPDETGCNWTFTGSAFFNAGTGAREIVGPIAVKVHEWARAKYNLACHD